MERMETICGVDLNGDKNLETEALEQSEAEEPRLRVIDLVDFNSVGRWLGSYAASDRFSALRRRLNQRIVTARKAIEQEAYNSTHYACENQSL